MPTQNFKVGEMLNKRTPNSKTWINFDGSYTTEVYNAPVHFEDENGNLQNINTDLFDEADFDSWDIPVAKHGKEMFEAAKERAIQEKKKNKLDRDLYDYQGLQVPFDCKIPRNFRRGYTIGKGQNILKFTPVQASPSKGYVDENQRNKIIYQDAWNDTDVTLEVSLNGLKETIILKTDRAPSSFSFEVDGPLADDLTAGNLKLQPAWLEDANGEKRDVSQTVRREGDKTFIDLVADVTGMTYPIEIDPTVTIQPDASTGIDTFVHSENPTANYGTDVGLFAGVYQGSALFETFIKFNISSIPVNADVINASVILHVIGVDDSNPYGFTAHEVTADWSESITWNTKPSYNASALCTVSIANPPSAQNVIFDVTTAAKKWVNGTSPNYGVCIRSNFVNSRKTFASSDHATSSLRPSFSLTYNMPPTAPTVITPNGGETWNAQHTISWNASTDKIEQYTYLQKIPTNKTSSSPISFRGVGQTFKVSSTDVIYKVGMYVNATTTNKLKAGTVVNLRYYDETTYTRGTIISTCILPADITTTGFVYVEFDNPQSFPLNTSLAVEFINSTGLGAGFYGDSGTGMTGINYYLDSSGVLRGNNINPYELEVYYGKPSPLQYQIQLSPDNGQTWKDIVALTAAGVTSYTYDFTNEPETSLAKIRIRAYDGTSYGPWDESDGVFTIQHNQAPTMPTNLSPSGGAPIDRVKVTRLSWLHNDPNAGDPQSKFDLHWRLQGAQTWNTITQATPNQFYDVPANTFPRGTIEWQVRTYDQAGLSSPYSNIQTLFAGDKPATPVITSPTNNSTVPVARPTVQWSSDGQIAYQVKVYDSAGANLLWDSGAINSGNKAQTILYDLANNTAYKIQVTIKNADGLWSDVAVSNITVSYTPPAMPIVTTTKGEGIITISIDNPTPSGTQPNVSYNDLYRRKQGESNWTRIATNIPADASFGDYTPASGQAYEYFVRVWGDNGTYSDSLIVSESVSFTGVWLHDVQDPLGTAHQFKNDGNGRSENWQATATVTQFAGRRLPVVEYDETEQRSVSVKLSMVKDSGDREALESLIKSKNTLCYRDGRGRKMFCQAFQLPIQDEFYGNTVSLTFEEVSYTEEV